MPNYVAHRAEAIRIINPGHLDHSRQLRESAITWESRKVRQPAHAEVDSAVLHEPPDLRKHSPGNCRHNVPFNIP